MAEKIILSGVCKELTSTDDFLDMSIEAQVLFFHLFFSADECGYLRKPNAITRMLEISSECLEELIRDGYITNTTEGYFITNYDSLVEEL